MIWGKVLGIVFLSFLVYYFLGATFIAKVVIFIAILAILVHLMKNGFGSPGGSRVISGLIGIIVIALVTAVYFRKSGEESDDSTSNSRSEVAEDHTSKRVILTIVAPVAPDEWSKPENTPGPFVVGPEDDGVISIRKSNGEILRGIRRFDGKPIGNTATLEFQSETGKPVNVTLVHK